MAYRRGRSHGRRDDDRRRGGRSDGPPGSRQTEFVTRTKSGQITVQPFARAKPVRIRADVVRSFALRWISRTIAVRLSRCVEPIQASLIRTPENAPAAAPIAPKRCANSWIACGANRPKTRPSTPARSKNDKESRYKEFKEFQERYEKEKKERDRSSSPSPRPQSLRRLPRFRPARPPADPDAVAKHTQFQLTNKRPSGFRRSFVVFVLRCHPTSSNPFPSMRSHAPFLRRLNRRASLYSYTFH